MTIKELKPTALWNYFNELNQIPRPSHHEEKIQAFVEDFGKKLGLETQKDTAGNVIIRKPATKGMEDRKCVILQSHLDMVPQANKDKVHNFETDPIETIIDGEWVRANGTTLGADNGIGDAAIMAILAANDIEHGPLEALFTSTEETGMDGARDLKSDVLKGDILLNLDSEDEGELYVGCAGGVDATFELPLTREALPDGYKTYHLVLNGLLGGHSGLNIIDQRANANKLLARWLVESRDLSIRLIDFQGGNLRNAIPREAHLVIAVKDADAVNKHLNQYVNTLENEFKGVEETISLSLIAAESSEKPLTLDCQRRAVNAINACFDGVYRMSNDMPNLVETSNNLAIIEVESNKLVVKTLLRSSVNSARDQLVQELTSVFELAGASHISFTGEYPGWKPNTSSEILTVMAKTGEQIFGKPPEVKAIHAGLECGLLGGHYPNWDMISFGPTIRGAHSPDERVHIESVATFYDWLLLTLKNIPKK